MNIDLKEIRELTVAVKSLTAVVQQLATVNADLTPDMNDLFLVPQSTPSTTDTVESETGSETHTYSLKDAKLLFGSIARESGKRDELHEIINSFDGAKELKDLNDDQRQQAVVKAQGLAA